MPRMLEEDRKERARERARAWYKANRGRARANVRAYKAAHPKPRKNTPIEEVVAKRLATYRATIEARRLVRPVQTPEEKRAHNRAWWAANRDKIAARAKIRREARRAAMPPKPVPRAPKRCPAGRGCKCDRCEARRRYAREWQREHVYEMALRNPDGYLARRERGRVRAKRHCARAAEARRKRLRAAGVSGNRTTHRMRLASLSDRFGGRCYICGLPTFGGAQDAALHPSVDHIVPITAGGLHVEENLALAHRGCNSAKRTRPFAPGAVPEWFRALRVARMQPRIDSFTRKEAI